MFRGLVLLAGNEQLTTLDPTSGIERRRITVGFRRRASPAEVADWERQGGEAVVLHRELPGLINWVLEVSVEEIRHRIGNLPRRVRLANLLGMAASNPVADWLMDNCVPEPGTWMQIGRSVELRDPATGKVSYQDDERCLYPNYLTWFRETGRTKPESLNKFRDIVIDIAGHLGHPLTNKRQATSKRSGLVGLRLRRADEAPFSWLDKKVHAVPSDSESVAHPDVSRLIGDPIDPLTAEAF